MATHGHEERRKRIPFWAHQLAELLLAVVLLVEGARREAGAAVLGAAVALLLFALATDGPLSAWRGFSRRAHRVGDLVLAVAFAAAPLIFGVDNVVTVVLLLGIAACLCLLGVRGDFSSRSPRAPRRRGGAARPSPTVGAAPPDAARDTPPGTRSARAVPSSREVGRTVGRLRAAGPRAAGRAVGRASAERRGESHRATATGPATGPDPGPAAAAGTEPGTEPHPGTA